MEYLFSMLAFFNEMHLCEKALAAFCLSIGVESWQTNLRKYAGKRKTHGQIHGQLHGGCCSRALQLTRKVLDGGLTFVLTISMRLGVST